MVISYNGIVGCYKQSRYMLCIVFLRNEDRAYKKNNTFFIVNVNYLVTMITCNSHSSGLARIENKREPHVDRYLILINDISKFG